MWTLENDDTPYLFDENNHPIAIVIEPKVEKLLVATPKLLAALERMVQWGQAQKTADGSGKCSLDQAREAIAEATGAV